MTENKQKNTLIVFVKYPNPGKVKTRLAKKIGNERATYYYSLMAKQIIDQVSQSDNYSTTIFFDPPEKEKKVIRWLGNGIKKFMPQSGANLGKKIANSFEQVISSGARRSIIIGTDCVEVTKEIVNRAFELLGRADVILGPTEDGGYYLLGLKCFAPELFENIDWSTERVLNQTLDRINEKNLSYELLEKLKDIDTVNDLAELQRSLNNEPDRRPS